MQPKTMTLAECASHSCDVFGIGTNEKPKLVPTGIPDFDREIGGYSLGTCNVIAAATGIGKSSFALYCATNQAKAGYTPAIISLEDPPDVYGIRAISALTGIDNRRIRTKNLTPGEEKRILQAAKQLKQINMHFGFAIGHGLTRIGQLTKELISQGAKIIYYDYLQKPAKSDNRRAEIDKYLSELHGICAENNVPAVFLSQLRRPDPSSASIKPNRYALKESGGIENESRVLIMLHPENGLLRCWIEKSTYGGEGTAIALVRDQSGSLRIGHFGSSVPAMPPPNFPPKPPSLAPSLNHLDLE